MLMARKHFVKQAGDTIVEVMIVLAVLGLAIGISYTTANRSLLNARQAQENAQATKLLQAQIEAIRSLACNTTSPNCDSVPELFNTANLYCIDTTTPTYTVVPFPAPTSYPAACQQGSVPYNISIRYTTSATDQDKFTAVATWPDILGAGDDTVTLVYRIHN